MPDLPPKCYYTNRHDMRIAYSRVNASANSTRKGTIMLVHGFASSMILNWLGAKWHTALADAGYDVFLTDVRGHGSSEKLHERSAYSYFELSRDLVDMIGHFALPRPHVMGFSMGARIVAYFAAHNPSLVDKLIIGGMGQALIDGSPQSQSIADALIAPDVTSITNAHARGYRDFAQGHGNDLQALASCVLEVTQPIDRELLAKISARCLIITGDKDGVAGDLPPLADVIAGSHYHYVPNRDHMSVVPSRGYKEKVLEFLG